MTQPTMTTTTNNMKPLFENIGGNQFKLSEDGEMSDYDRGHYENGGRMVGTRKQSGHNEADMNNPEEKREVEIGREIIKATQILVNKISEEDWAKYVTPIQSLARELIEMHGQQAE